MFQALSNLFETFTKIIILIIELTEQNKEEEEEDEVEKRKGEAQQRPAVASMIGESYKMYLLQWDLVTEQIL